MTGDTKNLNIAVDPTLTHSNKNGVRTAAGTALTTGTDDILGLDVFIKSNATGLNNNFMPMDVMMAYLRGNLAVNPSHQLIIKADGSNPEVNLSTKYNNGIYGTNDVSSFGFNLQTVGDIASPAFDGT